jgi:hypothetical protein
VLLEVYVYGEGGTGDYHDRGLEVDDDDPTESSRPLAHVFLGCL